EGTGILIGHVTELHTGAIPNVNSSEASFGGGIVDVGGGGKLVHNTGTFTRNGTGVFAISVPFDNDGTVEAAAGTLSPQSGGGERSEERRVGKGCRSGGSRGG